ncbi:MAG: hypothetical protein K9K21_04480 [Desulfotignum sp.]|nr:hypothetical protein [Desulfotignum sp.]MCF8113096.1 hypothetical protein [Desulfotignum sp.]MCF8125609.1 hypothetical protein [Desulfotignum sp.]
MATVNDVVLIYLEDAPVSFARVESILPDPKKDWYQITLLMLQIPMQNVTWILKDNYINGDDFQMNGKTMRLETIKPLKKEAVFSTDVKKSPKKPAASDEKKPESSNIISFADLKKKNHDQDPA